MKRAQSRATVGTFWTPAPKGGGVVFGAHVAADDFLRALARDGRVTVVCGPHETADVVAALPRVRAHSVIQAMHDFASLGVDSWLDVGNDVDRPFRLRRLVGAAYPIAVVHHTISYAAQLHDWFLRLLIGDFQPCDALICTSRAAQQVIENLVAHIAEQLGRQLGTKLRFRGQFARIPLGLDTALFRPRGPEVRRKLGLPARARIVLCPGRVSVADKADLLPLVQAFADVARTRKDALLVIAGSERAAERTVLRHFAGELGVEDRVVLRDLPPGERHLLHAAADVFVSPADNIQETFGITPIEAMACGVAQLVADWDGYRDTVVDGVTGFRIPTIWARAEPFIGDLAGVQPGGSFLDHFALAQSVVVEPLALRQRLAQLLDDATLRKRMGAASRAHAVATYDWRHVLVQLDDLWRDLRPRAKKLWRRTDYGAVHPYDAFSGYATRILDDAAVLRLSERGRAVLRGDLGLPTYFHDWQLLDFDLVGSAIALLDKRPAAVARLCRQLDRKTPARARRHLLWLLKYDLAEIA